MRLVRGALAASQRACTSTRTCTASGITPFEQLRTKHEWIVWIITINDTNIDPITEEKCCFSTVGVFASGELVVVISIL